MRKLKLFVWEGVLTDWTDGIMFALAHDAEEARRVILEKHQEDPSLNTPMKKELESNEPQVFNTPVGFYIYGGG